MPPHSQEMPTRLFYDSDCDLADLQGKTVTFIGYGNQGRAQALNLRDTLEAEKLQTPPTVVIANRDDEYKVTATEDGWPVEGTWKAAAANADVLFLLVPDQVQPELFNEQIAPHMKSDATLVIASGYNVFYKHLRTQPTQDIVMVAPRIIGTSVRSRFVSGTGFPCFVSVEQDGTGHAWKTVLALSRGIGATKGGVIESSAREETLMDLFAEQALFPTIIATFTEAYKHLKALGCSDEALVHEMWLSKEPAEIFEKCADDGFIAQLKHHSSVSQYGQLKGSFEVETEAMKKLFARVTGQDILGGRFSDKFSQIEKSDGGVDAALKKLYEKANQSELAVGERKVRQRLGLKVDRE